MALQDMPKHNLYIMHTQTREPEHQKPKAKSQKCDCDKLVGTAGAYPNPFLLLHITWISNIYLFIHTIIRVYMYVFMTDRVAQLPATNDHCPLYCIGILYA